MTVLEEKVAVEIYQYGRGHGMKWGLFIGVISTCCVIGVLLAIIVWAR